jgi:YD repeat-containing protein
MNSNITIGGPNILIDEVRVFTAGARMTSYSYDRYGNVISTCDSNNLITYHEYDDVQRKSIVRDENRNIVEYYQHKTKNQQ